MAVSVARESKISTFVCVCRFLKVWIIGFGFRYFFGSDCTFGFIFTLLMSLASALPAVWMFFKWLDLPWYYGFAVSPLFFIVGAVLCRTAKSKTAELYQSAYFLEYRKVRYESEIKGNFRSENHTIWSFTKKLKYAEAHGRLWKYVNAMAKTKKIPPDVYAETMY